MTTSTSISLPPVPVEDEEDSEEITLERRTKTREDRPSRPDQTPDNSLLPTLFVAKEGQPANDPKSAGSPDPLGDVGQGNKTGFAATEVASLDSP